MEKSTGEIQNHLETIIREIVNVLTTYGLDVVGAFVILIIGLWFSGRAAKMMERVLTRAQKVDGTLVKFLPASSNIWLWRLRLQPFSINSASRQQIF